MRPARDIVLGNRVLGTGQGPLVCMPLTGHDREGILGEVATAVRLGPDLIEWRVDYFDEVAASDEVLALAAEIRRQSEGIPLVFTLRSHREGGESVALDDTAVAQLCVDVCASGSAEFVDFEMSAPAEHVAMVCSAARQHGKQVILSYHNFRETPDLETLRAKFALAQALGGDIAKVAVMPCDLDDVLVLLTATLRAGRDVELPLISIAMGPVGALSRVIGWYFGSAVTFAAGEHASAPGQLSVSAVREAFAALGAHLPGRSS